MRAPVFIGSAFVAQYPSGGGIYWIPLQYVLGLKELGREVYWLELLWTRGDPAVDRECIDAFLRFAREYGVSDQLALLYFPEGTRDEPVDRVEHVGMSAAAFAERQRDGLLLNLANSITAPLRAGFGRTALLDLDPGTFQLWAREWDMGVGSHDAHLTIGMNLGAPDSPIPLDGVAWSRVWPVVHLGSWAMQPPPAPGAPYTTVTQWWNNHYAFLDGDTYDCNKRSGFLPLLPLAKRVAPRLQIAANLHVDETEDRALLARHGWRLVDPAAVAGTPAAFQRYVRESRGELSATKPAYVKARAGWISDRTVCYLASGRPCIVEETGVAAHLPANPGLRTFSTVDEAADAVRAVEADYDAASRGARALAEEVFAARVVLPGLLAAAGA